MAGRTLLAVAVSAVLAFAPAPLPKRDQSPDDLRLMQGRWACEKKIVLGDAHQCAYEVVINGRTFAGQRMRLDPKQAPKAIDLEVIVGDSTYYRRGIYSLQGDALVICSYASPMDPSDARRPPNFDRNRAGVIIEFLSRLDPHERTR